MRELTKSDLIQLLIIAMLLGLIGFLSFERLEVPEAILTLTASTITSLLGLNINTGVSDNGD